MHRDKKTKTKQNSMVFSVSTKLVFKKTSLHDGLSSILKFPPTRIENRL